MPRRSCIVLGAGFFAALGALPARAQTEAGRRLYEAGCAPCHGADGEGGEKGPGIVESRSSRSRARPDLRALIRDGIPAAGMPAFPLPDGDLDALAAYVAGLIAPAIEHPPAGDPRAGERFFFGQGDCARCHRLGGQGGFVGPDLSNLGRARGLRRIEQALRRPGARKLPGYGVVTLELRDGRTVRGLLKNESNYDAQVLSLKGELTLVARDQIRRQVREPASLMPALSASPQQERDLLAFLSRLEAKAPPKAPVATSPAPGGPAGADAFDQVARPRPGEWPTYHGHTSGNRHSPLRQIHRGNVARVAPKWMFSVPNGRRLEVTPLVVDGVMYVTAANQALALDPRTGRQIWHWSRP